MWKWAAIGAGIIILGVLWYWYQETERQRRINSGPNARQLRGTAARDMYNYRTGNTGEGAVVDATDLTATAIYRQTTEKSGASDARVFTT